MAVAPLESFQLGPYVAPRLFTGLWQLSSNAWGSASTPKIRTQMAQYADAGYTAFGELALSLPINRFHCPLTISL